MGSPSKFDISSKKASERPVVPDRGRRFATNRGFGSAVLIFFLGILPGWTLGEPAPDFGKASAYSRRTGEQILLIEWQGRQVLKTGPFSSSSERPVFSITKSLAALAVLCAVQDGWLSLDGALRNGTRVRALLTQTSGLPPGYALLYSRKPVDKSALVGRLKPAETAFSYGPSHYELLAALLDAKLGPVGTRRYVENKILIPLGMDASGWRRDKTGSIFFSAGLTASADQLLNAGRMVLRKGRVGWRRVVPLSLWQEIFRGTAQNPGYGMGFWLNPKATAPGAVEMDVEEALQKFSGSSDWSQFCISKSAPPDLVAMAGSHGQRVYVIPSLQMVIVRLGSGKSFRDPEFFHALFGEK